jgi:urate oxidase
MSLPEKEMPMSFVPVASDKKLVRRLAAEMDVSMSEVVRAIVRKFVRDNSRLDGTFVQSEGVRALTSYLSSTKT